MERFDSVCSLQLGDLLLNVEKDALNEVTLTVPAVVGKS